MSALRKVLAWWREWRPLFLWPVAWVLTLSGLMRGLFDAEYAHATFLLLLGHIIDQDATEAAKESLARERTP